MSNCFTDMSHPMYGYNRQDKDEKVIVSVTEEIRPCVRWKTKDHFKTLGYQPGFFDSKDVPEDEINCAPIKCFNTGTLFLDPTKSPVFTPEDQVPGNNDLVVARAGVTYRIRSRATRYALGMHFLYIKVPQKGDYELLVKVSDYRDTDQRNAYVWTSRFHANIPGHYLRTVDFIDITGVDSTIPGHGMFQVGNGWLPTDQGITISYELRMIATGIPYHGGLFGFSSPFIVNDRSELRKFSNVVLSCLTNFTHNVSVPATDARCFGRQYDPDQIEITKEMVVTTTSCNDYWLNPLHSLSQQMTSGIPVTDTFTVQDVVYGNKRYGLIHLPDVYFKDCNSITISSDKCECTYLQNIPVSVGTAVEDDEFILVSKQGSLEVAEAYNTRPAGPISLLPTDYSDEIDIAPGTVLVHEKYIGTELLVTYNAEREVELIVANDKRLKGTKFRVIQPVVNTRGIREYYVFNNVLITENSRDYGTSEEITLSLSFTVSRDDNGNFYEIRRNSEDLTSY